ncbi:hypothetical protein ACE3MZ_11595 [Paenibacillus sp. WLX1005]|uniref:hypothetical protein n=1 Tax=Paenibacillus sp. WLX1005 TaxID=3243766 RepID=UPI0039845FD8
MNKTTSILMNITLAGAALVATTSTLPTSVASAAQSEKGYITSASIVTAAATTSSSQSKKNNPYQAAGFEDPGAFDAFFGKLQLAVKKNNKQLVSSLVNYPLRVNTGKKVYFFKSPTRFIAKYDSIITPKVKKELLNSTQKDLFATWQGVSTKNGAVWMTSAVPTYKLGISTVNK